MPHQYKFRLFVPLAFVAIISGWIVFSSQNRYSANSSSSCIGCHDSSSVDDGYLASPEDSWDGISLGGYTGEVSAEQGGSIDFHISTDLLNYALTVYREGSPRQVMTTTATISGTYRTCTDGYQPPDGCNWPVDYTLNIPTDWPSGVYTVDIPTSTTTRYMVFWVREDDPGSTSKVLFLASVNTYLAYTNFGGKSVYDLDSDGDKAEKVSFNRPFRSYGMGDYELEYGLVEWAETQGYTMEYAANYDLEFIPDLLDFYDVVVLAGHSEYWTWTMRQRMKSFLDNGGRLINLSGNTMWWQIRYEDDGRTMVVYKDYELDSFPDDPQYGTQNPWDYPHNDPEAAILGVHWKSGGYFDSTGSIEGPILSAIRKFMDSLNPSSDPYYMYADGYGGYWVQNTDHWVFADTGMTDGQVLGRTDNAATSVMGIENDGTAFNCGTDGRTILGPLANTGTPANFTILGIAPVSLDGDQGFATMGIYTLPGGGAVFSGSTTSWSRALTDNNNTKLRQITKNVFDNFISGSFPQESASSESDFFFYDRFNCNNLYHSEGLGGPLWHQGIPTHNYFSYSEVYTDTKSVKYSEGCGVSGSGLELPIPTDYLNDYIRYRIRMKPDWGTTNTLYSSLYLNLSYLTMAEDDKFKIMAHGYDSRVPGSESTDQADLQIRFHNGKPQVRYQDAVTNTETLWVYVPADQPFRVETLWSKTTNELSMWVNGVRYDGGYYVGDDFVLGVDLSAQGPLNRADIRLSDLDEGENVQGVLCIDELALDDQRVDYDWLFKVWLPLVVK